MVFRLPTTHGLGVPFTDHGRGGSVFRFTIHHQLRQVRKQREREGSRCGGKRRGVPVSGEHSASAARRGAAGPRGGEEPGRKSRTPPAAAGTSSMASCAARKATAATARKAGWRARAGGGTEGFGSGSSCGRLQGRGEWLRDRWGRGSREVGWGED